MMPAHTPAKEDSSDQLGKYSGWQKCAMDVGRTFGVPTVLLLLMAYWLLWEVTPPIMSGMSSFLTTTMETQKELARTQADIAESQRKLVALIGEVQTAASEIVQAEKTTRTLMEEMQRDHATQLQKLGVIEAAVAKPEAGREKTQ